MVRDAAAIGKERRISPNPVAYLEHEGLSQSEIAALCRNEWRASECPSGQAEPDETMTVDDAIERHSDRYFSMLQDQLDASPSWPARFVFPRPQNDLERKGIR
jgi:hypothetical protein